METETAAAKDFFFSPFRTAVVFVERFDMLIGYFICEREVW